MNKADIESLAQEALDAFWQVITSRFPEATTGDLGPDRTIRLDHAAKEAIAEWIANNVPAQSKDTVPSS